MSDRKEGRKEGAKGRKRRKEGERKEIKISHNLPSLKKDDTTKQAADGRRVVCRPTVSFTCQRPVLLPSSLPLGQC